MGFLLLGIAAGTLSGLLGVGGGIIMVPGMVYFFSMTQHQAQGTSLAVMAPAVTAIAAWRYYQEGHVDLVTVAWIIAGFVIGSYLSADVAQRISANALKAFFGLLLAFVAGQMLLTQPVGGAWWGAGGVAAFLTGGWLNKKPAKPAAPPTSDA